MNLIQAKSKLINKDLIKFIELSHTEKESQDRFGCYTQEIAIVFVKVILTDNTIIDIKFDDTPEDWELFVLFVKQLYNIDKYIDVVNKAVEIANNSKIIDYQE